MIVPAHVLDEIRARVDLVDLVGAVVPLKRAGERWKGLCPFHQEKTPSFTVHPKLNLFHCFGCHAGGDAFAFLMRHDRLEFLDAVRTLAERTGVPLPAREGERQAAGVRDGLLAVSEWAARRFETWLWEGDRAERARRYLETRGIGAETARRFRLGYAPEGWDHLLGAARGEGVAPETLVQAGLALPRQTGAGHYDRFRGRLVFPIADTQGRVIAFGGRALGGEEPKYLNSPETALYQKGQTLYALHLAREPMAGSGRALLVEGYVDCLMAHQHGVTDTVAVLGTALTPHHLGLLRRYAEEGILFFDGDRAGAEAARRAEELLDRTAAAQWWALERKPETLARRGLRLRVAVLPAGHDPDTFLRQEGREALEACCRAARPLLLYALERALAEEDPATPRGRATGAARAALLLAKVQDADEAIELGREAARRLGIDPSDLWLQAQRLAGAARAAPAPAGPAAAGPLPGAADRELVQFLLQMPRARQTLLALAEPDLVAHPALRAILAALRGHPEAPPDALVHRLTDDPARAMLARLLVEEPRWPDPDRLIQDLERRLALRQRLRRTRALAQAVHRAQADGTPEVSEIQARLSAEARQVRADVAASPGLHRPIAGTSSTEDVRS
jgi:DNA primase